MRRQAHLGCQPLAGAGRNCCKTLYLCAERARELTACLQLLILAVAGVLHCFVPLLLRHLAPST